MAPLTADNTLYTRTKIGLSIVFIAGPLRLRYYSVPAEKSSQEQVKQCDFCGSWGQASVDS